MKFNIYSMDGQLSKYASLFRKKIDYNKHLSTSNNFLYLKDVEIATLEELLDLFSEFERGMGDHYGHITVDAVKREINILDSWIE